MKKNLLKMIVLTFVLSLSLAFTGCGSSKTALEKMLDEPEAAEMIASLNDSDDYKVELLSENGNILIYRFTYTEPLDFADDAEKAEFTSYMDIALNSYSSVYTSTLSSLRSELDMKDLSIRIEYCNADGSVLYSKVFK